MTHPLLTPRFEEEIWRPIPGYEHYEISNLGRVRKTTYLKTWNSSKTHYPVVQLFEDDGRRRISGNSKAKKVYIHRLLAEAFIPNPNLLRYINHIDGNKSNNDIANLEWCTASENIQHAYNTGLRKPTVNQPNRMVLEVGADFTAKKIWEGVREIRSHGHTWNKVYDSIKRGVFYKKSKWFYLPFYYKPECKTIMAGKVSDKNIVSIKEVAEYVDKLMMRLKTVFDITPPKRMIPVIKLDESGGILEMYRSIREAAITTDSDQGELSKAIKTGKKFKGFYWNTSTRKNTTAEYTSYINSKKKDK